MPVTLALTFGIPALLWGLGLASAPLILHLLHRRRFRERQWAAMQWLLEAIRKNYRRMRLEQWLLLAIRTLIIALVVLAMAKPVLEGTPMLVAIDSPATHNVILFDNSLSMHQSRTGKSCWERAKETVHAILDNAQQGDLASVVVLGSPTTVLVGDASPYLAAVGREIDAIRPQHGMARLGPGLDEAERILKRSRSAIQRVYLVTDMQRSTWVDEQGEGHAALAEKLRAIDERTDGITIIDVSGPDSPNLAVVRLERGSPLAVLGRSTTVRATVANFSRQPRSELGVEILVGGQVEAVQRISLAPGGEATANFGVIFREPGERTVEVRLAEDPNDLVLPDSQRHLVVPVRDSLKVLLVEGEASGEPFRSERDYLHYALSPETGSDTAGSVIRTEYRLESELLETPLAEWDVVVLCNVGQLSTSEATVLEEYVSQGGGVLFFLGSQVRLEAYNRVLFRDGTGLLPIRLLDVVGAPKGAAEPHAFDPRDYAHPVIAPFANFEQAGLLTTKVFRYVRGQVPEGSPASVVLAYETGDPAVVLSSYSGPAPSLDPLVGDPAAPPAPRPTPRPEPSDRFPRGRVAVVTTSADLDWNTWPISPSYLPVMQELIRHLVAGRVDRPSVLVGEPLVLRLGRDQFDAAGSVLLPDPEHTAIRVKVAQEGGASLVRYEETDLAGIYRVRLSKPAESEHPIAVNTWPGESDLSKLSAADLASMFPGTELTLLGEWTPSRQFPIAGPSRSGGIHRLLLAAALLLLLLESFLAWRFAHHR